MEPNEDKVSSPKPIQESVKKVSKIAATDKAAFKDILKAAVGKLLKNFGNKNTTGGKLDKKGIPHICHGHHGRCPCKKFCQV